MSCQKTEQFFGSHSPMASLGNHGSGFAYEPRPQQVAMARAVAEALSDEQNLCVEAPTGVGKTFAYLVPAYFHAVASERPVVISTHTINLQEQILGHDVPLLARLLGVDLRAVVAKGRGNYLCLRRLGQLINLDQQLLPGSLLVDEISKLQRWAVVTKTGDRSDLPFSIAPQLWQAVCSERGNCLGNKCPQHQTCFVMLAREKVRQAQIVVSNHAFLFSALAMRQRSLEAGETSKDDDDSQGLLPAFGALILDEGHTLEDCASHHLGDRVDTFSLRRTLGRLFNEERQTGLLLPEEESARSAVNSCRRRAELFFTRLLDWLDLQSQNPLRYTSPNHIEHHLGSALQRVSQSLSSVLEDEEDASRKVELQTILQDLEDADSILADFFAMSRVGHVYWFERFGRDQSDISFNIVPIDVAPLLHEMVFSRRPVIVASATLAVQGSITYFQRRVGALDSRALVLDSPFDFQRQVKVHIATSMPEPSAIEPFCQQAAVHIEKFLRQTGGSAFVLFTSYSMMRRLAEELQEFFEDEGLTLLEQGGGQPPAKMLAEFKATPGAVIFGTASFWTGVDVPGDALRNVIITRLPFSVPDHPLTAARIEKLQAEGGNAFMSYSVPEAVLKFRQGFGRLIRTKKDNGIVVILDSRVTKKYYGRNFLDSIPSCPVELF